MAGMFRNQQPQEVAASQQQAPQPDTAPPPPDTAPPPANRDAKWYYDNKYPGYYIDATGYHAPSFLDRAATYLSSDAYKKQMEELMKGPEMIRGREINAPQGGPGQEVGFRGIRSAPYRVLTSDDYQKLVIESLKLAAQQRVTRLSPPRISGLLG